MSWVQDWCSFYGPGSRSHSGSSIWVALLWYRNLLKIIILETYIKEDEHFNNSSIRKTKLILLVRPLNCPDIEWKMLWNLLEERTSRWLKRVLLMANFPATENLLHFTWSLRCQQIVLYETGPSSVTFQTVFLTRFASLASL